MVDQDELAEHEGHGPRRHHRDYGARETIDHTIASVYDYVAAAHPTGIDLLVDLASGPEEFARLASLVRIGGSAVTTRHVADTVALADRRIRGVNFTLDMSAGLLRRLANALIMGGLRTPPVVRIGLDDVPAVLSDRNDDQKASKTGVYFDDTLAGAEAE